jgi:hypothetical protein
MDGLKMMSHQSVAKATPSIISKPCGVCIQLFRTMIQKADIVVPKATRKVARCAAGRHARKPNSMMPTKTASRKKAVSTS